MKIQGRMKDHPISFIGRFIDLLNLLCLDVVIGALCSGFFASRILGVEMTPVYWVVLGLSVWIVYTLDHLVDAWRLKTGSHSKRHRFVHKYFGILFFIVAAGLIVDLILVYSFLGHNLLIFGSATGVLIAVYFGGLYLAGNRKFLALQKELIVAVFYTAGVWGPPLLEVDFPPGYQVILSLAGFLFLAISNALVLSHYDYQTDKEDRLFSFAVIHGKARTLIAIYSLSSLAVGVSAILFVSGSSFMSWFAAAIYLAMAFCTMILVNRLKLFPEQDVVRFLVECVFWMPGLALFI